MYKRQESDLSTWGREGVYGGVFTQQEFGHEVWKGNPTC